MTSNTATSVQTAEDGAVRAVLDHVYAAWAAGDADAFVALYAQDATAVLPGSHLRGRDTIRATMAAAFAGPLKGSRCADEVQSIRYIGAGAAIVISRSGTVLAGEAGPPAGRWVLATWVLSKQDGRWLVEGYHNCPAEAA